MCYSLYGVYVCVINSTTCFKISLAFIDINDAYFEFDDAQ
jgi:hypothetical protein